MCHFNKSESCIPVTHSMFWCGRADVQFSAEMEAAPSAVALRLLTEPFGAPQYRSVARACVRAARGPVVTSGLCSCEVLAAEGTVSIHPRD